MEWPPPIPAVSAYESQNSSLAEFVETREQGLEAKIQALVGCYLTKDGKNLDDDQRRRVYNILKARLGSDTSTGWIEAPDLNCIRDEVSETALILAPHTLYDQSVRPHASG